MNKTLVARLTMTEATGDKVIVDVHTDASFHEFYRWYRQQGRKRKVFLRTSHRGDGIQPHNMAPFTMPGLEVLAAEMQLVFKHIRSASVKVYKKKAYKKLLTCAADQLAGGLPKIRHLISDDPHWVPNGRRIPVAIKRSVQLVGVE